MTWLSIILSFSLFASAHAQALQVTDLKSGDVLLQSIPCYICSLIELEEGAPYSHIGVALKTDNDISVLQAFGTVQAIPVMTSIGLRRPHTSTLVLRAIDSEKNDLVFDDAALKAEFEKDFNGLSYDEAFLWDNFDSKGEKLYCSEFVAKFLNHFLPVKLTTKPMHYRQDRQDWINYFKATPPDGKPGMSPPDFLRSPLFRTVGEIN